MSTATGATKSFKDDEFPILCETCLGENPFIRMTREPHGKACKICDRPFTVYRWRPGPKARYKKTELCTTCSKIKNVCQTCVLDLQYGLPVQVRDSTLEDWEKKNMPINEVNREYLIEQKEGQLEQAGPGGQLEQSSAFLSRIARRTPYYRRNLPHICSFHARGECNRGPLCPFRHEMPTTGPLANQNIKDRYYGQNDPVASKILGRAKEHQAALEMPEDRTITTLWLGGVDDNVTESLIRAKFSPFGPLSSVRVVRERHCCFVTFINRADAEEAATKLVGNLIVNGTQLRMSWGRKLNKEGESGSSQPGSVPRPAPPIATAVPAPPGLKPKQPFLYASQDPRNMAARMPTQQE